MSSCFTISCRATDVCSCACVCERVSLGIPVSLKLPELNKSLADWASEQETGCQLNLTQIHQLEKRRGAKNVTFHPPVGLAHKQKGRQTESRSQITVLSLLLPRTQPPPQGKRAEEVCQPLSQATKTFNKHKNTNLGLSQTGHLPVKSFSCVLVPFFITCLRRLQRHYSLIRLHHFWSACCL